jgi:hypothetical protein
MRKSGRPLHDISRGSAWYLVPNFPVNHTRIKKWVKKLHNSPEVEYASSPTQIAIIYKHNSNS